MTIRSRSGRITRTDGPFAETKEFLGGFYLIEAPDLAAAVAIVESDPMIEMGSVEIRPFLEQAHSATGERRPPLENPTARMTDPRAFLRSLLDAAVAAALPAKVVPPHLPKPPKGRTIVLGAGKASAAMARAVEDHWHGPARRPRRHPHRPRRALRSGSRSSRPRTRCPTRAAATPRGASSRSPRAPVRTTSCSA